MTVFDRNLQGTAGSVLAGSSTFNLEYLSRVAAIVGALYAVATLVLNVGYMSILGPTVSEVVGVSDVFHVNFFIVEGLFWLAVIYSLFTQFISWPIRLAIRGIPRAQRMLDTARSNLFEMATENSWVTYFFFFGISGMLHSLRSNLAGSGFVLELLPLSVWTIAITRMLLRLHKEGHLFGPKLLLLLAFNPFILTFDAGRTWARHDLVEHARIISIQYQNGGVCFHRRLLRMTGSGLILYDDITRAYEFLKLDQIQGFRPGRVCT